MRKKIKSTLIGIWIITLFLLFIIGGSMVAESFETFSFTQMIVGGGILTFDFINVLGLVYLDYMSK